MTRPSERSPSICSVKETGHPVPPQPGGSTASMSRPAWKDDKQRAPSGIMLAPCSFPGLGGCHPGRSRFAKGGRPVPSRAGDSECDRSMGTQCPTAPALNHHTALGFRPFQSTALVLGVKQGSSTQARKEGRRTRGGQAPAGSIPRAVP